MLVQQGVWDMPLESMPLASGYLKAMILDDSELSAQTRVDIVNFRGGVTQGEMARRLFSGQLPDVLAFSVLGWNVRAFGALAETFKQLNPEGWVVFGGTHVTQQAERVFRENPAVDVIVNGEGEITFRELVRAHVNGCDRTALADVEGISYRSPSGTPVTTADRPRIEDLDIIPSPFLTGAIDLVDENGVFLYDVALVETNRGCPYKCAFCYWGGAVGQRVRAFSRSRLRAELELFAELKVHTVVACDANFGMMPIDLELVEDLIDIKEKHGFPRAFETSWAKNKSTVFYEIVHRMKEAELRSSFTLALQSLNPDALDTMNRRNMKVNAWQDLVQWLGTEGMDCYAELIWGAPGETVDSFIAGYDELARHVSRIAVYPIMLLPNTDYSDQKEVHGIIALRGDHDDFEYVLAHRTMSFADNAHMQRFLFWARVVAENAVLRHCWLPLREFAGWQQSQVLGSLADWADTSPRPEAVPLREAAARAHGGGAPAYATAIGYLFTSPAGRSALRHWWAEAVSPQLPPEYRAFLGEVFRYDLLTQPVCPAADTGSRPAADPFFPDAEELPDQDLYVRRGVMLGFDLPSLLPELRAGRQVDVSPAPTEVDVHYRRGALNAVLSTNHEEIVHFMGVPQYARQRDQVSLSGSV
ncbi:KedN5 family methylcobalamin-dependent radical SAM C-methyltransferase [Streptomyces sp. NBC_01217]|uniref:KedN5 family methylcobalamin-dependent radical SAM C-methyltransferase n=1 Tax=Streptomyces sp. NBC_01217 TaxID=2903779 RepID=UPI002E12A3E9|nr:KedN5 family methylcobalamin-dependent radical SAM C-methyltransferase [Streptomyces sp. NBC_01217]